jgi:hypothetical protein
MLYEYLYQYRYLQQGPGLNLMGVLISLLSDLEVFKPNFRQSFMAFADRCCISAKLQYLDIHLCEKHFHKISPDFLFLFLFFFLFFSLLKELE